MSDPIVAADEEHRKKLEKAGAKLVTALWNNHANLLLKRGVKPSMVRHAAS